jgi:glucokinase
MTTIGVDLGGTKLVAGLVGGDGAVLATRLAPTPVGDYDAALEAIVALVAELQGEAGAIGESAAAVGVAAAAFLDPERTEIRQAANLGWRDRPLRRDLEARLALPVTVVNDADAAAWGEHVHGAGKDASSLVLITLGTGVGGGVIVGGRLVSGANGLGGELGHLRVVPNGRPCACGARGCLEQYASGTALCRAARAGARARPTAARRLLALAGGDAAAIDGLHIVAAARDRDAVAVAALDDIARWLGLAVAHVIAFLDPAVVLVGGGLAAAGELLLAPARAACAEHSAMPALRRGVPLRAARLGTDAGMVGAAALARETRAARATAA